MCGVTEVLYGSVLWLLVHVIMAGDPPANLAILWNLLKKAYDAHQVPQPNRFGNMKMTMFTAKSGAKLRGKAAEVR